MAIVVILEDLNGLEKMKKLREGADMVLCVKGKEIVLDIREKKT
jgi:hypothetical protein